ncbi:MAG: hypothetical protein J6K83_05870 [Bacteroidaceae bacterium]|mgnify:CR=1 FL=1|nr:hypothetical protein [Bacteroidaceae bacterium]MBQ8694272.1 hypothetical protein [Bacteroidaceae bacterium]
MKKIMFVAVMAFAMVSCGGNKAAETQCNEAACCGDSIVATDVVPAAATDVLPAAVGETPATEVVPAESAN